MRWLRAAGALLLAAVALAPAEPATPSGGAGGSPGLFPDERITVGGRERAYRLLVPDRPAGEPRALVLAFHGFRVDSKDVMPTYSRLDALARAKGFILVYPNALEGRWRLRRAGNEDLAFFDALLQRLERAYPVDRTRVYATGMSNGAYFVNVLAAERSEVLAAVAPHSGGLGVLARGIKARRKYPVMILHGAQDRIVPVAEGRRARDAYRREGHEVRYVEVPGLGHRWAGRNEDMWAFFQAHAMKP
jgi:polyhydroxybutyrate depolymerase